MVVVGICSVKNMVELFLFTLITSVAFRTSQYNFILFQNIEERGKELQDICNSQWTDRHGAFEMLVDLLWALFCV